MPARTGNVVAFRGDTDAIAPAIVIGVYPVRRGEFEPDLDLLVCIASLLMQPESQAATVELQGIRFGIEPGQWGRVVDPLALVRGVPLDPEKGPGSVLELYRVPTGTSATRYTRPVAIATKPGGPLERIAAAANVLAGRASTIRTR